MEVIPIEQLNEFVEQTIRQTRRGVFSANQTNMQCRVTEITFQGVVVAGDGWQALALERSEARVSDEVQGGGSTENRVTKEDGTSHTKDQSVSNGERSGTNTETNTDHQTQTSTDNTSSSEGRTTSENGSTTSTEDRSGKDTRAQRTTGEQTHTYI